MKDFPDWFFDKSSWQEKTLGDVLEIPISNGVFCDPRKKGSGKKIINVSDLYNDFFIDESKLEFFEIDEKDFERNKVCEGDLFFTRSSVKVDGIGQCNIYLGNGDNVTFDGHIMRVRLNNSISDSKFVKLQFSTKKIRSQIMKKAKTNAMTTIGQEDLSQIKIKIPPLETQKKIADYFTHLDNAINAQDLKLKSWRDTKKAMLQKIFTQEFYFTTDNGEKYPAWQEKNLGDFSKLVRGPFGGSLKKEIFKTSGYKIYEQRNAIYKTSEIGNYFIDEKKFSEMSRFAVKENDFIVSCSGTIGKIYKIPDNAPKGIINQALLKITVNETECYTDYFYHHFEWDRFQNKIVDNTQGGAIKNLIGMEEFKNVKIKIPCLEEQKKIADYFNSFDKIIDAENKMLESLRLMKKGLLQKLFV